MTVHVKPRAGIGWTVDAAGDPVELGGQCGLFIDMAPDDQAPAPGDWVGTDAGSRYLVQHVHVVRRAKHCQQKRYQLRCARLPKHVEAPADVWVIWLQWYPRAASR